MLFKPGSINEDVTLGALVMFSFSFHCVLSGAQSNRPPLMGPILETLTIVALMPLVPCYLMLVLSQVNRMWV